MKSVKSCLVSHSTKSEKKSRENKEQKKILCIYVYVIARAGVIFGIYFRVVGIVVVKSHEAKPSAISPLYRKRVELSQNFTTVRAINILIPWLHNRCAISLFSRW